MKTKINIVFSTSSFNLQSLIQEKIEAREEEGMELSDIRITSLMRIDGNYTMETKCYLHACLIFKPSLFVKT